MSVFDLLCGTVRYRLKTENMEDFINSAKKYASLKNLKVAEDGTVSFLCFHKEQEAVEALIKQKNCTVAKKRVLGLPVVINTLLHRAGLVTGFSLSIVLVLLSTLFVWEIRVEGNETLSDSQVIAMLDKAGFREGMLKRRVKVREVADRVLINEDAVSWLAVNFDGTVACVEMKEAKIAKPVEKKENVNLVAAVNGIILRVDAHEGGTKVKKGDAVLKGQLLVSAFVDKRTGGSMLRGARGFVWANTERSFCVSVPLEYRTKGFTGKETKSLDITFLGKTLSLSNPFSKIAGRGEFTYNEEKMTLPYNVVLPVTVKTSLKREYEEKTVRRTKKQALGIARQTAAERLYGLTPGFVQLSVREQYSVEGDFFVYQCSFSGIENIAREQEFELS